MNILIFSHDLPYPANHGGRIDMYNRLKAFKELDQKVFLVCWALYDDNKCDDSRLHVQHIVTDLVVFKRKEGFVNRVINISEKLVKLLVQPNLVTQCTLSRKSFLTLKDRIEEFQPDVILVDNIYSSKLAYQYASTFNLPVFIRTHNIEHTYIREMAKLATSLKVKFKFLAMACNLKSFEVLALKNADAFFDISLSDLVFWKTLGLTNGLWMPPIYYPVNAAANLSKNSPTYFDIAYIGNLNSPNNIDGLFWFFEDIFPYISLQFPDVKVLVAGSKPEQSLIDYCLKIKNIVLVANPPDVLALYEHSHLLINPVRFGSGVNIKTVEMLHLGKPVVCTSKAIDGYPLEMKLLFEVSDEPEVFASFILKYLKSPNIQQPSRNKMIDLFKPSHLASTIEVMSNRRQVRHTMK